MNMEESKILLTEDTNQTIKAGENFAKDIKPGDKIFLIGELGAGKTTFTQGIAKHFNIRGRIISPTFVLIRKHEVESKFKGERQDIKTLYHIDLYRLEDVKEIKGLGLDEILEDHEGVFLIEWGDRSKIEYTWKINFEIIGDNKRRITFLKHG